MLRTIFHILGPSLFFLILSLPISSQVYILDDSIDGSAILTCSGSFYDSGGANGDYMNDEDYVVTLCSDTPGEQINLSMVMNTELTFDQISVFDGISTSSPEFPDSPYAGSTTFTVTSSNSCLTVAFSSGSIVTASGWEGSITCGSIDPCPEDITLDNTTASSCFICDGTANLSYTGMAFPADLILSLNGVVVFNDLINNGAIDLVDLCVGTYDLEIEDSDGCTYSESFDIFSTPAPTLNVSGVSDFCEGETVDLNLTLTGNGPWTLDYHLDGVPMPPLDVPTSPYIWTIDQPGSYQLDQISDTDCSVLLSDVFNISEIPAPAAQLSGSDTFCEGTFADLEISSTGTPPWTISYTLDGVAQADIITSDPLYVLQVNTAGLYVLTDLTDNTVCSGTVSGQVDLMEELSPAATLSGGGTICEGETSSLTVECTGTAPFTVVYAIDGVEQAPIELPLNLITVDSDVPGTYTLISVTSNGCFGSISGQATIDLLAAPGIDLPAGDELEMCQGGSVDFPIELSGNGPWNVEYTVDFGLPIALEIFSSTYFYTATAAGFYSFTTLSDQSCTANTDVFVSIGLSPSPTASLLEDLEYCIGSTGLIPIDISDGGTYELTFAIDGNEQDPIDVTGPEDFIPVSIDGNYTLISLTQGQCEGNVFGNSEAMSTDPPSAEFVDDVSFCSGSIGEAEVALSGTGPWTLDYAIDGVSQGTLELATSTSLIPINQAGTVSILTVTDQLCAGSSGPEITAVEHPLPTANISGNALICQGSSSTLDIAYTGSPDFQADLLLNGIFQETLNSNTSTQSFLAEGMGSYTLSNISDAHCDGNGIGAAMITYYTSPLIDVPLDTALCIGEAITVTGTASAGAGGPYTYAWVNGNDTLSGNEINLQPEFSQSLTFLVTDACDSPYAQQVAVTVYQNPIVELGNTFSELCGTSEVTLDTQTPLEQIGESCEWYIGNDTIYGCEALTYLFDSTGTFDVGLTVTTIHGCTSETSYPGLITINTRPNADFSFNPSVPNIVENQVSMIDLSEGAMSYEWFLDSILFSDLANPVLVLPESESSESWMVCQVITNEIGCSDTLCKQIELAGELAVFVPEAFTPDGDNVNDFFFPIIVGGSEEEYLFQIYDRLGNLVWESKDIHAKWSGQGADESSYFTRDGVYTWRMEVKRKNSVDKRLYTGMVSIVR